MEQIKSIETFYNGYRFRSRLEARWAVFFDALGIKYMYETEGYDLGNGDCYLPDFYLPTLKYYVEVKGYNEHIYDDIVRARKFIERKKSAMIILSEIPYDPMSKGLFLFPIIFYVGKTGGNTELHHAFFMSHGGVDGDDAYINDYFSIGVSQPFHYWPPKGISEEEQNDFVYRMIQPLLGSTKGVDDDTPSMYRVRESFEEELRPIQDALIKARQARFEHGERP